MGRLAWREKEGGCRSSENESRVFVHVWFVRRARGSFACACPKLISAYLFRGWRPDGVWDFSSLGFHDCFGILFTKRYFYIWTLSCSFISSFLSLGQRHLSTHCMTIIPESSRLMIQVDSIYVQDMRIRTDDGF